MQSNEVIDCCKKNGERILQLSQQAANVGILGTFLFGTIIHLVPLLLQALINLVLFLFQALFLYY